MTSKRIIIVTVRIGIHWETNLAIRRDASHSTSCRSKCKHSLDPASSKTIQQTIISDTMTTQIAGENTRMVRHLFSLMSVLRWTQMITFEELLRNSPWDRCVVVSNINHICVIREAQHCTQSIPSVWKVEINSVITQPVEPIQNVCACVV